MKLLTKENIKALPALYATDGKGPEEKKIPVKFFNPCGRGTWYAIEYDGEDTFFGYVELVPGCAELGYFSLSELASVRLPFGLGIERDLHWNPKTTLADVLAGREN